MKKLLLLIAACLMFAGPVLATTYTETYSEPATGVRKIGRRVVDSDNTVGAIVMRDVSGNFTAGTITGDVIGDVTGGVTAPNEVITILCIADESDALDGLYFTIASRTTGYKVWFNVDAGGNNPTEGTDTLVPIAVTTDDTASTIATAVQVALDALDGIIATVDTATVTCTFQGDVTQAADVDSGVTITVTTSGEAVTVGTMLGDVIGSVTGDLQTAEHGAGAIGTSTVVQTYRRTSLSGEIVTTIQVDMTGLGGKGGSANDVLGLPAGGAAYIGEYLVANYGVVYRVEFACIEAAAAASGSATTDIDVNTVANGVLAYDGAGGAVGDLFNVGALSDGQVFVNIAPIITAGDHIYLQEADTAATDGVYSAGQFILTFYGHASLD